MSGLELALAAAALLDRPHRHLVAVRVLDDRDDRPGRPHRRAGDDVRRPARPSRLGALAGGVLTFGAARARSASCSRAPAAASLRWSRRRSPSLAALAELRGVPILPQLRRQLPEHWRRVMPMPVAAGLYGVLLGLGFTTFVLTFGVFALAGIALRGRRPGARGSRSGSPSGSAGRCRSSRSRRSPTASSGSRSPRRWPSGPASTAGFRFGDGLALLAAAAALVVAAPAGAAATPSRSPAADPSVGGGDARLPAARRRRLLRRDGQDDPAAGPRPGARRRPGSR